VILDENHFMVFGKGDMLAPPISAFLARVEKGQAASRSEALADRLEAARLPFDPRSLPQASGMALVVLMLLLAIATFASEDLASIGTGLLVAQGRVGFFAGAAACFSGILFGDIAIYLAGRFLGRPWLGRAPLRWLLSPNAVEKSRRWFAHKGPSVIFASRFLPGTRVATYFAAGVLGTAFGRFLAYLGLAVALWVPLIVGVASILGARVFDLFDTFSRFALPGILALAIIGWLLFRTLKALFTRGGRRLLVGRWRRLRHWEFWPPWLFYLPVLLKVASLGLRHRNLTVFTAANPSMPSSGFLGESKAAILDGIDERFVARQARLGASLPAAQKRAAIEAFMNDNALDFPVVLKPDVGQRGAGVVIARTPEEMERAFDDPTSDLLVQEYIPGVELGVFYVRQPGEERGRIFSITEKHLPEVVGDGSSTVEQLILADERAVAMATVYLDRLVPDADRAPAAGERIKLVDIGTHCRGAIFLDGDRFRTPELEAKVEEISQSYDGFFFGRYDLKAPSYEAFQRGRDIKVIELNGVTSEATHIYDPANSLLEAYRTLFRQWELAFEIGKRNASDGAPVTSSGALLRLIWREWRA
jgi:membrane protein DedA with SNARE-associated domain